MSRFLSLFVTLAVIASLFAFADAFVVPRLRSSKQVLMSSSVDILPDEALFVDSKPALSIEEIASRYKIVPYGRPSLSFGLESLDRECYVSIKSAVVSRVGGIGLELEELVNSEDGISGVVLVSGIVPGSNAEKSGLFEIGDTLLSVTACDVQGDEIKDPQPGPLTVTGLNYDRTISTLGKFADFDNLLFTVQRLRRRGEVTVKVVGPQGEEVTDIQVLSGYNTNLRTALLSTNLKMYDPRTSRFDSPYETGNCGGEGTCGTCVVAVLEGQDLLNEKVLVEDKALKKQACPPNYRWGCRVKVGTDASRGGTVTVKLRPQTVTWDYQDGQ